MSINLSPAQKYLVDLLRSHLSMREANAEGSSYKLSAVLGDEELWEDVRLGINYFNVLPPTLTIFNSNDLYQISKHSEEQGGEEKAPEREDFQSILITPILMCSLFFTGMRLQWFEAGKHFRYNDNGISIERVKQQDYANVTNGDVLAYLNTTAPMVKKALGFKLIRGKGLFSGMISMPRSLTRGLRGTRMGFGG